MCIDAFQCFNLKKKYYMKSVFGFVLCCEMVTCGRCLVLFCSLKKCFVFIVVFLFLYCDVLCGAACDFMS